MNQGRNIKKKEAQWYSCEDLGMQFLHPTNQKHKLTLTNWKKKKTENNYRKVNSHQNELKRNFTILALYNKIYTRLLINKWRYKV